MIKSKKICYYCGADAVSKEHVPPLCFFPKGQRKNLITVPACDQHNKDLSTDQEYVRNMIVLNYNNNYDGTQLAIDKAFKAITNNPWLIAEIKRQLVMSMNKIGVPALTLDTIKMDKVFCAMGRALYYHDFGFVYNGEWRVFYDSNFLSPSKHNEESFKQFEDFKKSLGSFSYTDRQVQNPKIFQYAYSIEGSNIIYKLEFYEAYYIYILGKGNK